MGRQPLRFVFAALVAVMTTASMAVAGGVFLGITMDEITPSMARALQIDEDQGVLVSSVVEDSAAEAAGLESGDVILKIDDREVRGRKGLSRVLQRHDPGDRVLITVMRKGVLKVFEATLGERENKGVIVMGDGEGKTWSFNSGDDLEKFFQWKDEDGRHKLVIDDMDWALDSKRGFLGIIPEDLDEDEAEDLEVPGGDGVLIRELFDDAAAAEAGLEAGDVIVAIDGEDIDDGDDLGDFLEDTEPGQEVEVRVIRDGKMREYDVVLGKASHVDIAQRFKMFMPRGPHGPQSPRFYEFHTDDGHGVVNIERLREEQADMDELKDELAELKDELKKLREELQRKR